MENQSQDEKYNVNTLSVMLIQELVQSGYFKYSPINNTRQTVSQSVLLKRDNGGEVPESMKWVNYIEDIEIALAKFVNKNGDKKNEDYPAFLIHTTIPFTGDIVIVADESWSSKVPNLINIVKVEYMDPAVKNYENMIDKLKDAEADYNNFTAYLNYHKQFVTLKKEDYVMTFEERNTGTRIDVIRFATQYQSKKFQVQLDDNNDTKLMKVYDGTGKTCENITIDMCQYIKYIHEK